MDLALASLRTLFLAVCWIVMGTMTVEIVRERAFHEKSSVLRPSSAEFMQSNKARSASLIAP